MDKTDNMSTHDTEVSDVLDESFEVLQGFEDISPLEDVSAETKSICQKSEGSHVAKVVRQGKQQAASGVTTFELVEPPEAQACGKNLQYTVPLENNSSEKSAPGTSSMTFSLLRSGVPPAAESVQRPDIRYVFFLVVIFPAFMAPCYCEPSCRRLTCLLHPFAGKSL